jgi:hypothetical protein
MYDMIGELCTPMLRDSHGRPECDRNARICIVLALRRARHEAVGSNEVGCSDQQHFWFAYSSATVRTLAACRFVTEAKKNEADYPAIMDQTGHTSLNAIHGYNRRKKKWGKPERAKLGLRPRRYLSHCL